MEIIDAVLRVAPNVVAFAKDVVTCLAAIIASTIAIFGLQTWRKQLKGKTEYELARRLLRAALKVRNAIIYVRSPLITASEFAVAMKEAGIQIPEGGMTTPTAEATGAVYERRWKRVQDALIELEAETLEAEVTLGSEISKYVDGLYKHVRQLNAYLQLHIQAIDHPDYLDDAAREKVNKVSIFSIKQGKLR